jgi:Transposase and inactivated derivatives, IS30 family
MSNSKFKHLSDFDRSFIEASLNSNMSFKDIADPLGKDPSTIAKEIKKHRVSKIPIQLGYPKNMCSLKKKCNGKLCSLLGNCNYSCRNCHKCNSLCSNYHYVECETLSKPPYVCNPCSSKRYCTKIKYLYSANLSHNEYKSLLSSSRQGINISESQFTLIDNLVSDLVINNGLSIAHIVANNKDDIHLSQRTIYRYFDYDILSAKSLDLPRKLSFKPRKSNNDGTTRDYAYLEGRRYSDFIDYSKNNPHLEVIEIDCVEGTIGSSVFLTMIFRNSGLMLIFKLDHKTSENVNMTLKNLITYIGKTRFKKYFPIILSDRGSEFRRLFEIENDRNGNLLTRVFYCDAHKSYQKGTLEQAHTHIRKVYPKGNCLDSVSHKDTLDLMNNINNYSRKALNGKTPLEIFKEQKPIKFVDALNQKKIAPNRVCLRAKMPRKQK